jgi:hypothetical protein
MRQIDGGTIEKHLKLLVATVWIVVINPSTRSFLLSPAEPRRCDHPVTRTSPRSLEKVQCQQSYMLAAESGAGLAD